jgi:glutamate--cysteine ligase
VELKVWAGELLERILPLAELLDRSQGSGAHVEALAQQQAKVADVEMTPSAQVLAILRQGQSFTDFALQQSLRHAEYFRARPLDAERQQAFEQAAHDSLAEQAELEAQHRGDFDAFVAAYQASILALAV